MVPYSQEIEKQMESLYYSLNEKDRRRYSALEANRLGWGGVGYISKILRCDTESIGLGRTELLDANAMGMTRIRRPGGGRKSIFKTIPGLDETFLKVLSQHTAGSPMDETVKWTNLTRPEIVELLKGEGVSVSVTVVDQLLARHHYRKRQAQKRLSCGSHEQRNDQFENIEVLMEVYQEQGNPVISMDTKKRS